MQDTDNVCLCFKVNKGKIVNYCKRESPQVASLISECLSAGTGCGWCVPYLEELHQQCADGVESPDLSMTPEEYEAQRKTYNKTGERPE